MSVALAMDEGWGGSTPREMTGAYAGDPPAIVLSYYAGMRSLRSNGDYCAAVDRLRRNVGTRSSRSGNPDPSNGGSPAAGQCRIAVAA